MRYDYVTMIKGLGGRRRTLKALDVGRPCRTTRTTRNEHRAAGRRAGADRDAPSATTPPGAADVDLERPRHRLHRHRRPVGVRQDDAAALLLGTSRPQRGSVVRRPGLTVGYVPQLETVNWNFPVTVAECVLMARTGQRAAVAVPRRTRRRRATVLDRLGIAASAAGTSGSCPADSSSGCSSPGRCCATRSCCCWTSPLAASTSRTRHEMLHLLAISTPTGVAIMLTTHDLNGIAAHLPELVALHQR